MSDTAVLTVRLSRETKEALERIAGDAHRSKSFVASVAVESYVKRQIWWHEKMMPHVNQTWYRKMKWMPFLQPGATRHRESPLAQKCSIRFSRD